MTNELIKLIIILNKKLRHLLQVMQNRLDEMHKGWARIHIIFCLLICCFVMYNIVIDYGLTGLGFSETIEAFFLLIMISVVWVVVPYVTLLCLFLWIKEGFYSKK